MRAFALASVLPLAACMGSGAKPAKPEPPTLDVADSWVDPTGDAPARSRRPTRDRDAAVHNPNAPVIVIRHATIMTADGQTITDGAIVLSNGAIEALGADASVTAPGGARVVDGTGKFVTPGLIDAHSHLGVYAAPSARATDDGNEITGPVTAQVRAQYGYWPQDPQISRASAAGVTSAMILPGSANLIGGEGFTVVMRTGRTTDEVAFPGAPRTLKMACGENPKRVYGEKGGPHTRMGEYAAFRAAFNEARGYLAKQTAYERNHALWLKKKARAAELDAAQPNPKLKIKVEPAPEAPPVDLRLETLAAVLHGDVLVQIHCYKASDIAEMVAVADESGFQIRSFHHSLEAYKVRDLLVAKHIAINTWSDWWGFKLEAFDGIPENAALFTQQGGRATIHSDSPVGIQWLNKDAAKAMAAGRASGIPITEDQALRWVTANPAWVLGIDDVTGSLKAGKRADVVVWSGSPFSVYSLAELVIAGGEVTYDRSAGATLSDFELGNAATERTK
jgi:imidazolonepropionase-like amidohydrolase